MEFINQDFECVVLEDKLLNKKIDLNKTGAYVFFAGPDDKENRFDLHFTKYGSCRVGDISSVGAAEATQVLQTPEGASINFNFSENTGAVITATNVIGQELVAPQSVVATTQKVNVALPADYHGVYFIRIQTAQGEVVKKFVRP